MIKNKFSRGTGATTTNLSSQLDCPQLHLYQFEILGVGQGWVAVRGTLHENIKMTKMSNVHKHNHIN